MEITGKLKLINETQAFGSNNFRKRELVVTTDEQYPQDILVEFVQDKTDLLNSFKVGEDVKISINIRGREWVNPQGEAKYFNSIQGWKIEKNVNNIPVNDPVEVFNSSDDINEDNQEDDLPF